MNASEAFGSSTGAINGTSTRKGSAKPGQSPAAAILAQAQTDRCVIQDFCPLAESIEWSLGQRYWQQRGSKAFLGDQRGVPYIVTNDGTFARQAAEVFFRSLVEAERHSNLPPQVFALELGIGVGLFARFFLDAFQDLCLDRGKDYYDRFNYIAADRSQEMLWDACRHGVFANHPGRVLLRVVDALQPEAGLLADLALADQRPRPLRAVFLNYLLDCLPAAVIEEDGAEVRQLCVRTCLARGTNLNESTSLSPEEMRRRAASRDPREQAELMPFYGLFASEYEYRPVEVERIPYGAFAVNQARAQGSRLLHSYGAIRCLERLLNLLQDGGFVVFNEYGQTQFSPADQYEHQRFSHATSIGLNFALLKAFFQAPQNGDLVEPAGDNPHIHSRLLGRQLGPETTARFRELFSKAAQEELEKPVQAARELARVGRLDAAASCYQQALDRQPANWFLMNEVADFLTQGLGNPKAGLELAKVALDLNPTCASSLWCSLGDALYYLCRVEECRSAYLKALQINENDVRARFSLAWVHAQEKDFGAALQRIGEALVLDVDEVYRERLLQKQAEVLQALSYKHQQERLRMANRINPIGNRPGTPIPPVAEKVGQMWKQP